MSAFGSFTFRSRPRRPAGLLATLALVGAATTLVLTPRAASALPSNCTANGPTVTCMFLYNGTNGSDGTAQQLVIPATTRVTIDTWGAQGGGVAGGLGGHAGGTMLVPSGTTLTVRVGGQPLGGAAGFNGGGAGSVGGGGASDVRQGGDALANRIVVAGGGGGAGCEGSSFPCETTLGGAGGGPSGANGDSLNTGGSDTRGGTGGETICAFGGVNGGDGIAGSGGNGGSCEIPEPHRPPIELVAAGGGGGLFGGGGGGVFFDFCCVPFFVTGSGAGGSGFVVPSASSVVNEQGVEAGNGLVMITYMNTPPNKDACKNSGWRSYVDDQGRSFTNQGQCVAWVQHHD